MWKLWAAAEWRIQSILLANCFQMRGVRAQNVARTNDKIDVMDPPTLCARTRRTWSYLFMSSSAWIAFYGNWDVLQPAK